MEKEIEAFSQVKPEEDALIGRCVRAFGLLERACGMFINAMARLEADPKVEDRQSPEAKEHASFLAGSFDKHASYLEGRRENISRRLGRPVELIDLLSENLRKIGQRRNLVCHGVWLRSSSETLTCVLWNRDAVKQLREATSAGPAFPYSKEFTQDGFARMEEHVFLILGEIEALRKAANLRAG